MDKKDGATVFLELDRPSNASFPPDNDKDSDNDKGIKRKNQRAILEICDRSDEKT